MQRSSQILEGQAGNNESFQCNKVLKKLKRFAKESSLRVMQLCPVMQLYAMKHRSTQHCIFIRNSPIFSRTTRILFGIDIVRSPFNAKCNCAGGQSFFLLSQKAASYVYVFWVHLTNLTSSTPLLLDQGGPKVNCR